MPSASNVPIGAEERVVSDKVRVFRDGQVLRRIPHQGALSRRESVENATTRYSGLSTVGATPR